MGPVYVSVIVPVRNGAATIRECLQSILSLRFPPEQMELICVDNDSRDATPAFLGEFGNRVRVIHEKRLGAGAARNAGLRAAQSRWIAFTDADCVVDPHWLGNLLSGLQDGTVDAVGGRILAVDGAGVIEKFGEIIHDHRRAIEDARPPHLITMNLAMPLALLQQQGGFDERWLRSQDAELAFRLVGAGCRFAYAPAAVVRHRNASTLRELWHEGYTHGYWGVELYRAYSGLKVAPGDASAAGVGEQTTVELTRWQRAALERVFRNGKRCGFAAGRWFPPAILSSPPVLLRDKDASA
jgi:cellulose synthase/poly-beta-1,6-N-acetylglucosamine synthase-like glycosyltransferase